MVKKYMHENLKHIVTKHLAKKKYSHFQAITTNNRKHVSDFISNIATPNQYYTLFQTSNKADIFRELLVNNTTEFISNNTDIFRKFLPN